jgi:alpha-galactosidase
MLRPSSLRIEFAAFALATLASVSEPCAAMRASRAAGAAPPIEEAIRAATPVAITVDPAGTTDLRATIVWRGDFAEVSLANAGTEPVAVREVVLFDLPHGWPGETPFYGEGLQMLAQTAGTLASPVDVGDYPDRSHYRLPEPEGFRRVYSVTTVEPAGEPQFLAAFTSCRRFVGAFDLSAERIRGTVDCEGLVLDPGESWALEGLLVARGDDRGALLGRLATALADAHPRTAYPAPPAGWCSWYCFGPAVTARNVLDNLAAMERDHPDLRFVQIDDGYQPTMGDWLDTGPGFGGRPVEEILREIRGRGREPAIWVAPFVASPDSKLLREHPDWFVQGDDGKPMPSDRVMFGGWRLGPWYVLDGTHPEVARHLETLFATMRREWQVSYFKLDAIFWGMMHGGRRHDPKATRVEAYRRGMEAIRRGAGEGAYILGCNHPIWPSLGLVDGSRSSLDIARNWTSVWRTGRENLLRGWQNGALWWNDPDTLVQTGLPANEARFHATLVWATGGAMLAGDDLATLPADKVPVLRALARPTGVAARFADLSLGHGVVVLADGREAHAVLNWSDAPRTARIAVPRGVALVDRWNGARPPVEAGDGIEGGRGEPFVVVEVGPRDAVLLEPAPPR